MTNKQIIIDVSKCKECGLRNCEGNLIYWCHTYDDHCKDFDNCYYKALKRKEQEYEELRQCHNKCCEENAKKEVEWLEKYNQVSRDFYNGKYCNKENCNLLKAKKQELNDYKKQFKADTKEMEDYQNEITRHLESIEYWQHQAEAKEQECEELKKLVKKQKDVLIHKTILADKFSKTLTEIKEIAEKCCINQATLDCENYDDCTQCGRISDGEGIQQILQKISECEVE